LDRAPQALDSWVSPFLHEVSSLPYCQEGHLDILVGNSFLLGFPFFQLLCGPAVCGSTNNKRLPVIVKTKTHLKLTFALFIFATAVWNNVVLKYFKLIRISIFTFLPAWQRFPNGPSRHPTASFWNYKATQTVLTLTIGTKFLTKYFCVVFFKKLRLAGRAGRKSTTCSPRDLRTEYITRKINQQFIIIFHAVRRLNFVHKISASGVHRSRETLPCRRISKPWIFIKIHAQIDRTFVLWFQKVPPSGVFRMVFPRTGYTALTQTLAGELPEAKWQRTCVV